MYLNNIKMKTERYTAQVINSDGRGFGDCKSFSDWRSAKRWADAQFKKDSGVKVTIYAYLTAPEQNGNKAATA